MVLFAILSVHLHYLSGFFLISGWLVKQRSYFHTFHFVIYGTGRQKLKLPLRNLDRENGLVKHLRFLAGDS
jgi:hypothetical protein